MNKTNYPKTRSGMKHIKTFPGKEAKGCFASKGFIFMFFGEDLIKITNPETGEFSIVK